MVDCFIDMIPPIVFLFSSFVMTLWSHLVGTNNTIWNMCECVSKNAVETLRETYYLMIIMRHGMYTSHVQFESRVIQVNTHAVTSSSNVILDYTYPYVFIHIHLRIQVAVDVVLLVPEAIHGDPEAERLHLGPHTRETLADPRLDEPLLLNVGRRVVPAAEPVVELATVRR
jgi:hypothetical protein